MAQFVKHFVQDLTQDIKIRQCGTIVFNADNLSNVISVDLYNGTEPYSGGGTVAGAVICPDGATVALDNGTLTGNVASVTLKADCFAIPGQIGVGVQVISGSVRTTVLKAIYNVELLSTDDMVDPDSRITASVTQLVADIEAATAEIPASDMASLRSGIAPTFSASTAYPAGAYVYYNGTLYKFTSAHAAGSWTGTDATAVALGNDVTILNNDVSDLKSAFVDGLASETMDGWEKGGFNTTNGNNYTDNTRIRSQTKIGYSTGVCNFKLNTGYSTLMYAWDLSGNYVGAYKTDGTWSNAASNWKSVTEFDLSTVPNYVVKFAMTRTPSSSDITASEGNQLVMYKRTDSGFTQENKAADAKAVGKLANTVDCIKGLTAENVNFGWLQSTDIYSNNGNDRDNRPTRSRSGYILLPKGAKLTVTPSPWYIQWYRYNGTTKAWIDASSFTSAWTNSEFSLKYDDADYYFRFVVRDANANANVTAANITVVGKMQYPIVSSVTQNTSNINSLLENDSFKIVTPRFLRICGGIEQNIYYQNILQGLNAKEAYEVKTSTYATNYNDFARLSKGDTASETHGFKVNVYPHNSSKYIESQTIDYKIVPKSSGSGLSKKVMIIGDSLTFNQPMTKHLVDNLLSGDVMTVSLVGTLGDAPYKREGRSGWGAYTYTHEASHTNESGTTFTNAFWNPSSSAFDFSYYANEKYETITGSAFPGVDYVFICLGTNDFGRTDIAENLQTMITSIHTYNADIRIGVWTPPPRGLTGNGSMVNHDVIMGIVSDILTAFEGLEASRIYTVPVTLNVDPYHDFPMESVNVSADNTEYQMLVTTDKVHPSNAGYAKMADMIYSYIKYFGSLDAT